MKLKELREFVESQKCLSCGAAGLSLDFYPHDGGEELEDLAGKQWFYGHCSACGIDSALWKLVNAYQARLDMGMDV